MSVDIYALYSSVTSYQLYQHYNAWNCAADTHHKQLLQLHIVVQQLKMLQEFTSIMHRNVCTLHAKDHCKKTMLSCYLQHLSVVYVNFPALEAIANTNVVELHVRCIAHKWQSEGIMF